MITRSRASRQAGIKSMIRMMATVEPTFSKSSPMPSLGPHIAFLGNELRAVSLLDAKLAVRDMTPYARQTTHRNSAFSPERLRLPLALVGSYCLGEVWVVAAPAFPTARVFGRGTLGTLPRRLPQ